MDLLIDKGFDQALGARPLKRAIQRLLEDPFADFILRGQVPAGTTVKVRREEDQLEFDTPHDREAAAPAGTDRLSRSLPSAGGAPWASGASAFGRSLRPGPAAAGVGGHGATSAG